MSKDVFNALLCVLKLLSKVKQNQHELKSLKIKIYLETRQKQNLIICFLFKISICVFVIFHHEKHP